MPLREIEDKRGELPMNWKCIAAATLAVGSLIQPRDAGATNPQQLEMDEYLFPGQALRSTNCRYTATMQGDGQFVVRDVTAGGVLWMAPDVYGGGYMKNWAWGYIQIFGWDDVAVWEAGYWSTNAPLIQTNNGEVISQSSS